jgi:hypothetical protein
LDHENKHTREIYGRLEISIDSNLLGITIENFLGLFAAGHLILDILRAMQNPVEFLTRFKGKISIQLISQPPLLGLGHGVELEANRFVLMIGRAGGFLQLKHINST